jgi:hypothetical protein
MRFLSAILALFTLLFMLNSCGIYSFSGADTAGAKTFSVDYFQPVATLASPLLAQRFTESLKDLVLQQSTLKVMKQLRKTDSRLQLR